MSKVSPIPHGYRSVTPTLTVRDASAAIDFYKRAFEAVELPARLTDPTGRILHAELRIGDSLIVLTDEFAEFGNVSPESLGGSAVRIALYVDDVDAVGERAIAAGAKVLIPIADQFYGDRSGRLLDPFGHVWIVSTHREDMTPEEMQRRADVLFSKSSEAG